MGKVKHTHTKITIGRNAIGKFAAVSKQQKYLT